MNRKHFFIIFSLSFLLCFRVRPAWVYQPDWPTQFFNPNPIADGGDFLLPIPGGGAIIFRPVIILQDKITGAKQFTLGNVNEEYAPEEYPQYGSISGVFEKGKGRRLFYIGKYEITESQYQAVMSGKKPSRLSNMPQVSVSWFEAVRFCHQMTLWLMKHHRQLMPKDGGALSYIRLPTEEEWEFACRGGEQVQANFFYRDHFVPDNEKTIDYIQFFRAGDIEMIQAIGKTKKPNPLGIFDMLGNVGEICFNVFRLNYNYGRSGGFVVRGGDYDNPGPVKIRSSFRIEVPFYNQRLADSSRSDTDGLRVIITAPLITSMQRDDAIENEWNKDMLPAKGKLRLSFDEALIKINYVYNQLKDPDLKRELRMIKNSHDSIARELYEIEKNDAVIFFRIGGYAAFITARDLKRQLILKNFIEEYKKDPPETRIDIEQNEIILKNLETTIDSNLETYGDAVESLFRKYSNSPELVIAAYDQVIKKKKLLKQDDQISAINLLLEHVRNFSQRNASLWREDINNLRSLR